MRDEVLLDDFEHILLPRGAMPFFICPERYVRVEPCAAEAIIIDAVMTNMAYPNWDALSLLGIAEHPRNLHPRELEQRIVAGLRARRFELYEQLPISLGRAAREPVLAAPLPLHEPLHYIAIQAFDEDDEPLPNLVLVVRFANDEKRTLSTGASGSLRVDGIAEGPCAVQHPAG